MNKQTPVFPDTLATHQPVRVVFHLLSTLSKSTLSFTRFLDGIRREIFQIFASKQVFLSP